MAKVYNLLRVIIELFENQKFQLLPVQWNREPGVENHSTAAVVPWNSYR